MTLRREEFHSHMRKVRPDNFTRDGLDVLYDMLSDMGTDIEFDPIVICCTYVENTIGELLESYDELMDCVSEYADDLDIPIDDVSADEVADILSEWTFAVPTKSGTIVYEQF